MMRQTVSKISVLLLIFISGSLICIRGQAPPAVTEIDPSVTLSIDLPKRTRIQFYTGSEKTEESSSRKTKVGAGFSFRMKPVHRGFLDSFDTDKQHVLVLGTVYEFSRATEGEEVKDEHKWILDGTFRYEFVKRLLFSDRNRFENRWIDGDHHFRYRNRPALERPFKALKREFTPYIASEAVWDQRYKKWNILKFSAGVMFPVYSRFSLDLFYDRQHCTTCVDPNTNIFGLDLGISLRLGKKK